MHGVVRKASHASSRCVLTFLWVFPPHVPGEETGSESRRALPRVTLRVRGGTKVEPVPTLPHALAYRHYTSLSCVSITCAHVIFIIQNVGIVLGGAPKHTPQTMKE